MISTANILMLSSKLQSESPSATTLNDLGVYLLVSLFFVVAALIEFAFVLLVQRKLNAKVGDIHNKERKKLGRKERQKSFEMSLTNGNAEHIPKVFELNPEKSQACDTSNGKQMKLVNMQLSTENIDTMACILFILFYLLFNLFYWI